MTLSHEEFLERLNEYNKINNTFWITDEEYKNNNLVGIGNIKIRYDFYLPNYK